MPPMPPMPPDASWSEYANQWNSWWRRSPIDGIHAFQEPSMRQWQGLTPLKGMKLDKFSLTPGNITKGIEIVRGMKSIYFIGPGWNRMYGRSGMKPEEFWKKYDAGEFE